MLISNDPGPWQYYVNRTDNKGLSLMEIKNKYMKEQLLFEQHMNFQMQQQMVFQQQSAGGGKFIDNPEIDPSENEYLDNDYIDDYFI